MKPYPCPDWRAEGAIVKSISHGIWTTVVRVDSKKFTQDGREGTAERIVACVNACEGIDNATLAAGKVQALREVNAELVAALEGLFEQCAMVHKHWGDGCNRQQADDAQKAGRAAIARARGLA